MKTSIPGLAQEDTPVSQFSVWRTKMLVQWASWGKSWVYPNQNAGDGNRSYEWGSCLTDERNEIALDAVEWSEFPRGLYWEYWQNWCEEVRNISHEAFCSIYPYIRYDIVIEEGDQLITDFWQEDSCVKKLSKQDGTYPDVGFYYATWHVYMIF